MPPKAVASPQKGRARQDIDTISYHMEEITMSKKLIKAASVLVWFALWASATVIFLLSI